MYLSFYDLCLEDSMQGAACMNGIGSIAFVVFRSMRIQATFGGNFCEHCYFVAFEGWSSTNQCSTFRLYHLQLDVSFIASTTCWQSIPPREKYRVKIITFVYEFINTWELKRPAKLAGSHWWNMFHRITMTTTYHIAYNTSIHKKQLYEIYHLVSTIAFLGRHWFAPITSTVGSYHGIYHCFRPPNSKAQYAGLEAKAAWAKEAGGRRCDVVGGGSKTRHECWMEGLYIMIYI